MAVENVFNVEKTEEVHFSAKRKESTHPALMLGDDGEMMKW